MHWHPVSVTAVVFSVQRRFGRATGCPKSAWSEGLGVAVRVIRGWGLDGFGIHPRSLLNMKWEVRPVRLFF